MRLGLPRVQPLWIIRGFLLIPLALTCFALLPAPNAFGVVPAPDGGYPGFNTAEGQNALFSLTTGIGNTAVGWSSLSSNTDGSYNTALGAGALLFNVGDQSTGDGTQNTAIGAAALLSNTTGQINTAIGTSALLSNTAGSYNTATGLRALGSNTTGSSNVANGERALASNTEGSSSTAIGSSALSLNIDGSFNTALGHIALVSNRNGDDNTAIGEAAGLSIDGSGNVCIGEGVYGLTGVNDTTWIRNVYASVASARAVYVNSDGKLGTLASSRRFKEEIKPMDKTSEAILALKPVTFRYKQEIDSSRIPQFGLVAEDVAKVNPDLVVCDKKGEIYSVRYEAVNAMLLNEFLKEHRTVKAQQKEIDALKAELKEQRALIQQVNDKMELNRPAPQIVANDR